jgi:hypothetical protein
MPKAKVVVEVSAAAAAAALVDPRTRTSFKPPPTQPPSSTEPPSTTPTEPSSKPPSKEQQAVSAAVAMKCFEETVNPKDYPTLLSKTISLQTDKDITRVLQDIIKFSKSVRSVDLLKVLNYNDMTTSLVEVPCSAKRSGFRKQAQRS